MEPDKDGYYHVPCGKFEGAVPPEHPMSKGQITQEVAHPTKKKSYPGSDGARIPISVEGHSLERSEKPRRHVHKPEDVQKNSQETQLYLDHFLGKNRRSPYLYGEPDPAAKLAPRYDRIEQSPEEAQRQMALGDGGHGWPREFDKAAVAADLIVSGVKKAAQKLFLGATYREALDAQVGRGRKDVLDLSGIEDQMIMYCGAIDHGSFDDKLSRSPTDRRKVLRLITSARGNVIKYIGRTPSGTVFMTTYKNTTIGELIQNPMRAYILLGRRVSSNYRLDEVLKKDMVDGKIIP